MAAVSQPAPVSRLADGGIRKHKCPSCPRAFKRSEHCQRHARSHTQEKPFPCRYCAKPYSRKDLVTRHEKTLHADQYKPADRSGDSTANARRPSVAATDSQSSQSGSPQFHGHASAGAVDTEVGQGGRLQHSPAADLGGLPAVNPSTDRGAIREQTNRSTSGAGALNERTGHQNGGSTTSQSDRIGFVSVQSDLDSSYPGVLDDLPGLELFDTFFDGSLDDYTTYFQTETSGNNVTNTVEQHGAPDGQTSQESLNFMDFGILDELSEMQRTFSAPLANTTQVDTWSNQAPGFPQPSLPSPSISHESPAPSSDVKISDVAISSMLTSDFFASATLNHQLPKASTLRLCLRTYFEAFNVHLPLFHMPTFKADQQPAALLLAMAAIGALYRLERHTTAVLYLAAEKAAAANSPAEGIGAFDLFGANSTAAADHSREPGHPHSLSDVRTRLLLTFFGIFSGNQKLTERALSRLGETAFAYQRLARRVKALVSRNQDMTWSDWVVAESTKRVLHGMWVISNLITTTYNVAPAFSINHDGELELPCPEALWHASTTEEWSRARGNESAKGCLSIRDAVSILVSGETSAELSNSSLSWSPFAAVIITHVLATQLWHASHAALPWTSTTASGGVVSGPSNTMTAAFEAALTRCHNLINPSTDASGGGWIENENALLFNAFAVLRVCYCRAAPALSCLDRSSLLRSDPSDFSAVHDYVAAPLTRNKQVTSAIARAFEGIWVPSRKGALLVRKTAALTWSIEHAIAGWDTVLLVSKWAHEICSARVAQAPVDQEENDLLESIAAMLQQTDSDAASGTSLAARLTRYWATFYDDTWVWGVSLRMATVLRSLADAYE